MNTRKLLGTLLASVALTGCANMTEGQRGTATGAGVGAAAGAAIGALAGGGKGAAIGAATGAAVGAGGGYLWSKRMQEQKQVMEQATEGTGVAVVQTADNQLKLEIPSDVSFDTGQADIKPGMRPVLDRFAQTLTVNSATTVRIVGHTDSTGSDAVNDPLSVRRAATVREYLTGRGVVSNRVAIDGRGAHEPIADNGTLDGRARNRRVEIYVADTGAAPAVSSTYQ